MLYRFLRHGKSKDQDHRELRRFADVDTEVLEQLIGTVAETSIKTGERWKW